MELIRILKVLRQRSRWVALGLVVAIVATLATSYKVSLVPPGLKGEEKFEYGAGSTQILIDSRSSALGALDRNFEPLQSRAAIYSRLITSPVLLGYIGRAAGIPAEQIYAQGPFNIGAARQERESTAERRASELFEEGVRYRLRFEAESGIPVMSAYAIAPTAEEAVKLADGAAEGLKAYIEDLQDRDNIAFAERVDIGQMGPATGGIVNEGADTQISFMVGIGIFLLWCFGVVFIFNALEENRRTEAARASAAGRSTNGAGRPDVVPDDLADVRADTLG